MYPNYNYYPNQAQQPSMQSSYNVREAVPSSSMIVTPAAVANYFNVHSTIFVDVPRGCCSTISVKNITTSAIAVQNANLIVERVA